MSQAGALAAVCGARGQAVRRVRAPHLLLLGRSGEDAQAKQRLDGATAKGLVK